MILTRNYSRVAILNEIIIERLLTKYRLTNLTVPSGPKAWVHWVNDRIYAELPGKEDLVTEWILSSIAHQSGRPEDIFRFIAAASYYFEHVKEPKFKEAVKEFADPLTPNPKNILEFTLHGIESIIDIYKKPPVDPRVNELQEKLPEGASLIYNDGKYQIVEVTSPIAACDLARGTKWCTSDAETAEMYITGDPLYVIYLNGRKYAQFHAYVDVQLMNLRDIPLTSIDDDLRNALLKSGLFEKALIKLDESVDDVHSIDELAKQFIMYIGEHPSPELVTFISKLSALSYLYARYVLHERFPQGEGVISNDSMIAVIYAETVLKDRFKEAELKIIKEGHYLEDYILFLDTIGKYNEFLADHPDRYMH